MRSAAALALADMVVGPPIAEIARGAGWVVVAVALALGLLAAVAWRVLKSIAPAEHVDESPLGDGTSRDGRPGDDA